MPPSKLSSFFRTVGKTTFSSPRPAAKPPSSAAEPPPSAARPPPPAAKPPNPQPATFVKKKLRKAVPEKTSLRRRQQKAVNHQGTAAGDFIVQALNNRDSAKIVSQDISTILGGSRDWYCLDQSESEVSEGEEVSESDSNLPWFSSLFNHSTPLRRKELSRDRKNKWIFKNTQKVRFGKLVSMCLEKLGSGSTFEVLYKMGRGTGLKEYNAFIRGCIETARKSKDERVQTEQILEVYRLLQLMKERGFPIEEETFGPVLLYLIDNHMEEQFILLLEIVKDEDLSLHPRLGYYEMLLWIEMDNEEKVQELCEHIATGESELGSLLHENYMLALCERDRKTELIHLLDIVDITRFSSFENVATVFRSLGRLALEAFAELFILVLKDCDYGAQSISPLIYSYASSLKSLAVEDVILKFKEMHGKLDLPLVAESYEKLIAYCCDSLKVHLALDLVDEMCEAGLTLSTETLNAIFHACEENHESVMVRRMYSMVRDHNLKPNSETFRSIINLNVRMKDFDSAYSMLEDLKRFNLMPSASMYNTILAGYYREKNMNGVSRVLNEMKGADVKPDSQTYSFLIGNCTCEEDIVKYHEELKLAGVHITKNVFMSLINAYAACGLFEKAKKIIEDEGIPVKNLVEIKSVLVSALASHGQIADALDIYKEMKQSGCCLEPKAIISLIEYQHPQEEMHMLLQLLDQLNDSYHWVDGCCRVILCCIRNKDLRSAVELLKELAEKYQNDELVKESMFDEVFSLIADMEPPELQIGLDLLKSIREDLGLHPSRKCLDFLLSACVSGKDLEKAQMVWKEYKIAGLPHNILSLLRMYQVYLAAGHLEEATSLLSSIPKDDSHVRYVIHAFRMAYGSSMQKKKKQKKKKKKNCGTDE